MLLSDRGGATGTAMLSWMTAMRPALIPDARVEERVAQIDQQIDQYIDRREDQDDSLDNRVVAAQDRVHRQASKSRDREHRLGHDDAGDQQCNPDADDRHD